MWSTSYDILIVGAGIAGSALAHSLSAASLERKRPLNICLLERSLAEPDRIVGELLQPGGVMALRKLGLAGCVEGIDAIPTFGYCVMLDGKPVHIPYPDGHEGVAFHHGRFIQALRAKARSAPCVDVVEATVSELIECPMTGRVLGVRATRREEGAVEKEAFFADLTVIADGCFSNFRNKVMGTAGITPEVKGHFVGMVLEDAQLPIPKHGTVMLVEGFGPVLSYQIGTHETRILIDVKNPVPSDLKAHIQNNIIPQLPAALHAPAKKALENDRLRRMPNSFLPAAEQGKQTREGVILLGDSWNMRHPLTGGGMTVAFNDVVILRDLLLDAKHLADWPEMSKLLNRWHWARKPLSSTVNILSVALYDLFGADDPSLEVLRTGCFKYFELGGACVRDPVSLLAAIEQAPFLLFRHFFTVAFYSIWVMFTHPRQVGVIDGKPVLRRPRPDEYPFLAFKSIQVFWMACIVFLPLVWTEVGN
ncbi:squalene monooxygenase [Epithele typhae]|uniref:squalene monooxygenase n=1 Tax=Epithele typhae TaxID=378194 RepID=UPI00200844A0|nr:squalene monooxygenase [Epithele typhae]KAH9933976.1 squalene monooxygenase [Epithele typhae]